MDSRVSDWRELTAAMGNNVGVVVVDNTRDGMSVVSRVLSHQHELSSVSFLTYGQAGEIQLGSTTINAATIMADSALVSQWGDAMAQNGQILFWGCDVGQGSAGQAFVDDLHTLTGAGVAASTDATGLGALGGDWTLERTSGLDGVAVDTPFSTTAEADYDSVLDAPQATVTITNTQGTSTLLGNSFSQDITLANNASNGVGYAPFVEIFAPTNSTQNTPLSSVTYLGQSLNTRAVTLVDVNGTVGAYNPYSSGTDGKPQFVAAPAGFQAGDKMYVVSLPFGSYTPNEPSITLTANFSNNTTESVSAPGGTGAPIIIAAAGGYQYGADALNDPGTDPTIQGAVQVNTVDQNLVQVSAGVTTSPRGEDEVPTGPSYPANYEVTVTPSEATANNPIQNMTLDVALPDSVNYTNGAITLTGADGKTISGTATYVPAAAGSTAGGSVHIVLDSVAYSADAPYKVDIPVYVGQTDAAGNAILDTSGGVTGPTTIPATTISYTGNWTAPGTTSEPVTLDQTVDTSSTVFSAKAFAAQETDTVTGSSGLAAGQVMPGDTVTHDIHIENSDYYSSTGMKVSAVLNDGQTLQAGTDPTFTYTDDTGTQQVVQLGAVTNAVTSVVNGQTIQQSGSNQYWSYTQDASGQTTVTMNIGQYLTDHDLPPMGQGQQGTISYASTVLDDYVGSSTVNPVTEDDTVSSSVTVSAAVTGPDGTVSSAQDGTGSSLEVPKGSTDLQIVAINGVPVTPDEGVPVIHAGDAVTYEATYNLQTSTYSKLDLSSYLPLPLYDTGDPAGTGASTFTAAASTAMADQKVGTYSVLSMPGDTDPTANPAPANVTVSTDATTNSVTFNMGSNPTVSSNDAVQVLFTVKATSSPFADGLSLTSQEKSVLTNGEGDSLPGDALQSITVGEPEAELRTGIVSVTDDDGANQSVTYAAQTAGEAGSTDPTGTFNAAGTTGGAYTGTPTSGISAVDDLNASGANGGDTVRIASTVENTGSGGMYDLTVAGTLPAGFSASDVKNFQVTRPDGSVVYSSATDATAAAASYFTTGGLTIPATSATAMVLAQNQDLTITYDLTLPTTQNAGDTLTAGAHVVNFGNSPGAVAEGNGFVSDGVPLGGQASDIADPASVTIAAPTITKTIGASDLPVNDGVDASGASSGTIVSGETRPTTITVTLPEGSISNGGNDVTVTETLPKGEDYVPGSFTYTMGTGVTSPSVTLLTPVRNSDGTTTLTFDLGKTVTNTNTDTTGTIALTYNAYYGKNSAPADGAQITTSAVLNYSAQDGTGTDTARTSGPATATVTERTPDLSETITDNSGGKPLYSGEQVTYTVTLTNTGKVTAYDITHDPAITADLKDYTITPASDGSTFDATSTLASLAPGASETYTITGTVASNLPASTTLPVTDTYSWSSAPAADVLDAGDGTTVDTPQNYSREAQDTAPTVGNYTAVLDIVGEGNATTPGVSPTSPVTADNTVPGDTITLQGEVTIPKGQNGNVVLTIAVPTNIDLNMDSLRLLLASEGGAITSSTLGDASGLQFNEGTNGTALTLSGNGKTFVLNASAQSQLTLNPNSVAGVVTTDTTSEAGETLLKINLGTVTNNDMSSVPNYGIIQVTGTVANTTADKDGTSLKETLSASRGATKMTSSAVQETVKEPTLTLRKTVESIDYANGTVTFVDTVSNAGHATAYDVALDDPLLAGQENYVSATATGGGTVDGTLNPDGSLPGYDATTNAITTSGMALAAGKSETVTYTVSLADLQKGLAETTTNVTWKSLNEADTTPSGGQDQSRDGSATDSADTYVSSVTMGLGTLSGQIWQALGNTPGTYDSAVDTALGGVGVTVTARGQDGTFGSGLVQSGVTTDASGDYAALVPVYGTPTSAAMAEVSVPTTGGTDGLPTGETQVYDRDGTAGSTVTQVSADTTGGMSATHADLAYELPDTAPTIAGWQDTTPHTTTSGTATALGQDGGSVQVADSELDALTTAEGGTYSYAGTTLVVQRYVDGKAAPSATDSFGTQTGSGVTLAGDGTVNVNGTDIGTYTDKGGVLQVAFNASATKADIATLAQDLTYTYTPTGSDAATQLDVTLGATFADGNTDLAGQQVTTGAQGTGGVQTSTPMLTRVSVGGTSFVAGAYVEPNDTSAAAAAIALGPYVSVEDASGAGVGSIGSVTVQIGAARTEDMLTATTTGGITASMDTTTGTLTLTAGKVTTLQDWQATLASLKYYDSSDTPTEGTRSVSISVFENGAVSPSVTTGTLQVAASNDSPVLDPVSPLDAAGVDVDSVQQVTVHLGSATAQDMLAAAATGGITASMDTSTGTLTLTAGKTTTLQDWQATLASVKYYNSTGTPTEGTRDVSISVLENGSATPVVTAGTIAVTAANDSPVFGDISPLYGQEDSGPPQGAVGTAVSQLAGYVGTTGGAANVTDPDGTDLTGQNVAGSTPQPGIAITNADTTHGTWWYSTDNGRTWTEFAGSSTSVSVGNGNALHLIDNGQARIYFQSTDPNWNGRLDNALTFRAWDQFDGAANGSISALPATGLGTGINTPGSAYSAASDSVALMDENVNDAPNVVADNTNPDAPVVTGNQPASWQVTEDTARSATVQALFGQYFSDTADQQESAANPDGSIANTMAGIAVVGYTPSAAGTWSYSTDGGKTWTQIDASVSATDALVLSNSAQTKLQFTPAANYNGAPVSGDDLKVVLIDGSDAQSGSPALLGTDGAALSTATGQPLTGAALAASGGVAVSGVDVSTRGGQTALSVGTVDLSTHVAPVNDPPVMNDGPYDLPPVTTNGADGDNTGATIASLYGSAVNDAADGQKTAGDPAGSTADTLGGIAITGNAANPVTQGTWQYSTDGGKTWTDVPADVSGGNALVLGDGASLRFDPVPNFTGAPGTLTTQVVETSTDVPLTGTSNGVATSVTGAALDGSSTALGGVDITGMQQASPNGPVSLNSQPLGVTVRPDSHADVTMPSGLEDQPGPKETVSQLFTTTDPNGVGGVAITGNATPAGEGTWMYIVPGGTAQVLPGDLSARSAVVLPADARIWFQPAPNFNGDPSDIALTATVVDNTAATAFTASDGTTVAGNAITAAVTGVDVSHTGGGTALDAASLTVRTGVVAVNDAPVVVSGPDGTAVMGNQPASWQVTEDTARSATVQALFGQYFSDTADQQESAANPDGSTANTMAGIAVVGYTPSAAGTWSYSTDGGKTWTQIDASVSATDALVLSNSAQTKLQFTPAANYNGAPVSGDDLKVVLIDSSDAQSGSPALVGTDGAALSTATGQPLTGAALAASGGVAVSGVDVSTRGGQTALSVGTVDLSTHVAPVNDPPVMNDGPYDLPPVTTNGADGDNTGATIASLYGSAVNDAADGQKTAGDPAGSTADTLGGIAITGNAANPVTQGTWQYSTDGGKTWTDVPADVSGGNALVLGDGASLRFDPVPNFTGTPGTLTTQVVETSTDVPLTGTSNGVAASVTGAALDGSSTALGGVDITGMQQASPNGPVSLNSQPLGVTVRPDSHADVTMPSGLEDQPGPKETVSQLFTTTDPNGVGGVAITGNATPAGEGTWMYIVPGGTAQALPGDLSARSAVVLPADARIWFQPAPNFNGDPSDIALTATVVDNTAATAFTASDGTTVAGNAITTAVTGVDVSHTGAGTALDGTSVNVRTSVMPVNDAPVASGSVILPSEYASSEEVRGESVAALFGPTFSDAADQQRSAVNPDGSVADHLQGIAIVGNTANPATQGVWQYSTDNGQTWQQVSTSVSSTAALVLPANAELHFAAVLGFSGTPGGLSAALVETGGTLATTAHMADVSAMMADETSHISSGTVPVTTRATYVQWGNPALSGSTLNNDISSSDLLKTSVEDGFETEFQRGFGVAHQTWIRGTSIYRFVTTGEQYDIDVPSGAFISSDGTDLNLTLTARQAGGAPLPDWVSFDAQRRSFSMIAPDDATGSIDLTVIGRDEYGHEAEVDVHVVIGREHPAWQVADDPSMVQAVDRAMQVVEQDMNWLAFNPDFHRTVHKPADATHGKRGLRAQMRQMGLRAAHARGRNLVNQ
ncbi:DUF4347 domain-containing protein [Komagataeibacter oboediens]|nr:DUF4347 domain-containing protein [Komagataeibacter oboediens]